MTTVTPEAESNWRREVFVCASGALLYALPFLASGSKLGVHDWELFTAMAEIPRVLVLKFGQFPFWNPYIGGGNILFHHPEVGVLSPFFVLILAFGAVVGLKLQVLFCYFLGFWGSVRLARALGMSETAGYLFGSVYFGSAFFALHFAEGHIPFTQFCFLPWVTYFWLKSFTRARYVFAGALTLALMILGNGAAAPFLFTSTFIGAASVLLAVREKSVTPLKRLGAIWLFGIGVSAIKFLPMFIHLQSHVWAGEPLETTPLQALFPAFFSFDQGLYSHRNLDLLRGWHEYSAFIFFPTLLLAGWQVLRRFSQSWLWLALALFFFLLGLGGFAEWSPWRLLSHLPGFASSRAPSRAFQFVILPLGILAGYGFDTFRIWWNQTMSKKGVSSATPRAIPLLVFGSIIVVNGWIAQQSLNQPFVREPVSAVWQDDFRQTVGKTDQVYQAVLQNRGVLLAPWLSAYEEGRGLVTADGSVLDEYINTGEAQVLGRSYRGNEIRYRLRATTDGEIILGMGYDEGWKVVEPPNSSLRAEQGLLAVTFSAGDSELYLRYRPPYFYAGMVISLLSLAGLVAYRIRFKPQG